MKRIIFALLLFILFFFFASTSLAQTNQKSNEAYYKGEVTKVIKEGVVKVGSSESFFQDVEVKFLEGPMNGQTIKIQNSGSTKAKEQKSLKNNEKVIILASQQNGKTTFSIWDKYRLNYIYLSAILFFALILIFAGIKGLGSIAGMVVTFVILMGFIVPQILKGHDPLLVSILGSVIILMITIFLAHGVSKKTTSAVVSTFISLAITGILAYISVKIIGLSGFGDENVYMLQLGSIQINPQGLLLGGIIIGTLGVLDDVTTTQSAAIFEMAKLDKRLSITDLFVKGYNIGREHIASVVNTLILAYAGASLGLFVIFVLNPNNIPSWVILNSEMVSEEVIRAIVGSIGLILAVPITTLIASYVAKRFI